MEQIYYVYLSYGVAFGLLCLFTCFMIIKERRLRNRMRFYVEKMAAQSSMANDIASMAEREIR